MEEDLLPSLCDKTKWLGDCLSHWVRINSSFSIKKQAHFMSFPHLSSFSYLYLPSVKYIIINSPLKCHATEEYSGVTRVTEKLQELYSLLTHLKLLTHLTRDRHVVEVWAYGLGNQQVLVRKLSLILPSVWSLASPFSECSFSHSKVVTHLLGLWRGLHEVTNVKYWTYYKCPVDMRNILSGFPKVCIIFLSHVEA